MKTVIFFLTLLIAYLGLSAQGNKKVYKRFSEKYIHLTLTTDSIFFLSGVGNCEYERLRKGKWTFKNDSLMLYGFSADKAHPKGTYVYEKGKSDSLVVRMFDYLGQPYSLMPIGFTRDTTRFVEHWLNDKDGVVIIPKSKYAGFYFRFETFSPYFPEGMNPFQYINDSTNSVNIYIDWMDSPLEGSIYTSTDTLRLFYKEKKLFFDDQDWPILTEH